MVSPQSSVLLLVCLACFSLFNMKQCNAAEPPLPYKSSSTLQDIKDTCTEMPVKYSSLCIDSLKSDPRSFRVFFGLLPNISMYIAMENATAVRSDIQNAIKTERENAVAKGILRVCVKKCDVAIRNIQMAIPSYKFPMEPYGSPVDGLLNLAQSNVTNCRNQMKKYGVQPALLPKVETVKRLISVALDLIMNEEV